MDPHRILAAGSLVEKSDCRSLVLYEILSPCSVLDSFPARGPLRLSGDYRHDFTLSC